VDDFGKQGKLQESDAIDLLQENDESVDVSDIHCSSNSATITLKDQLEQLDFSS